MNTPETRSKPTGTRPVVESMSENTNNEAGKKYLSHEDYTVGWVCALLLELVAATTMLDEEHEMLPLASGDRNTYTLGRIGRHNVVLVCLPSYGNTKAATVASHMLRSFPNISVGLMVGIGGGVPTTDDDIRLGDIIVGELVVQYDQGKMARGGKFERTSGTGKSPPDTLITAVQSLRARYNLQQSRIPYILTQMMKRHPSTIDKYDRPSAELDNLFIAEYDHVEGENDESTLSCDHCDMTQRVQRPPRPTKHSKIHYGKIASGSQVMKHGTTRDRLAHELGAICFEMEAAGLVDANFPCLVVRGISDYADSHKNNQWQGYAASAAVAYTKELLSIIPGCMPKALLSLERVLKCQTNLANPPLVFSSLLLRSIRRSEAQLRHLLVREHNMTRSVVLKELRTAQLTVSDETRILTPPIPVRAQLSEDLPIETDLHQNSHAKRGEIDTTQPEPSFHGSPEIKNGQTQLGSAIESLNRLGTIVHTSAKDMQLVSTRFHHDVNRMALKIKKAERLKVSGNTRRS